MLGLLAVTILLTISGLEDGIGSITINGITSKFRKNITTTFTLQGSRQVRRSDNHSRELEVGLCVVAAVNALIGLARRGDRGSALAGVR